jgi:uridine kinase
MLRPSPAVASVLSTLDSRPARLGSTRLVGIDGPAGSGKTTLARSVSRSLRAQGHRVSTVHMDSLYAGWTGLTPELEGRVITQVLAPLAAGAPAHWQRYDWHEERFTDWVDLVAPEVLLLEGCGSGARAYAAYLSVLVWLEAASELRIERGLERDGSHLMDHWLAWMDLEASYFAANRTRERADLRLDTG